MVADRDRSEPRHGLCDQPASADDLHGRQRPLSGRQALARRRVHDHPGRGELRQRQRGQLQHRQDRLAGQDAATDDRRHSRHCRRPRLHRRSQRLVQGLRRRHTAKCSGSSRPAPASMRPRLPTWSTASNMSSSVRAATPRSTPSAATTSSPSRSSKTTSRFVGRFPADRSPRGAAFLFDLEARAARKWARSWAARRIPSHVA